VLAYDVVNDSAASRAVTSPKVVVVTGYVKIPGHPRGHDEYDCLGARLGELRAAPVRPFRCALDDCWLHGHVRETIATPAVADNPKKNTLAYHVVQHQKTAWLLQAAQTDPSADVLVWIDYGIFHQPGVTARVVDDFLHRVRARPAFSIPGVWEQSNGSAEWPDWHFCGSSLVVPRDFVRSFHEAVRDVTLERLKAEAIVTWEINDWAAVEERRELPIHWYKADHNQTQFTNY
jgi:hypothetical protein